MPTRISNQKISQQQEKNLLLTIKRIVEHEKSQFKTSHFLKSEKRFTFTISEQRYSVCSVV